MSPPTNLAELYMQAVRMNPGAEIPGLAHRLGVWRDGCNADRLVPNREAAAVILSHWIAVLLPRGFRLQTAQPSGLYVAVWPQGAKTTKRRYTHPVEALHEVLTNGAFL